MDLLEKAEKISRLLRTINKNLHREIHKHVESFGLTVPQLLVVKTLMKEGSLPISGISERIGLTNSTISGIVDRLEKEGYVLRNRDDKDRRVVHVSLTENTLKLAKEMPVFSPDYFSNWIKDLEPAKVDQIIDSLSILANINNINIE